MSEPTVINTGVAVGLLIREWQNANGERFISVAPQYRDRSGVWKLSHSGLVLTPDAARELAPALLAMAAAIEASPVDPAPTQEDREESRWP